MQSRLWVDRARCVTTVAIRLASLRYRSRAYGLSLYNNLVSHVSLLNDAYTLTVEVRFQSSERVPHGGRSNRNLASSPSESGLPRRRFAGLSNAAFRLNVVDCGQPDVLTTGTCRLRRVVLVDVGACPVITAALLTFCWLRRFPGCGIIPASDAESAPIRRRGPPQEAPPGRGFPPET